MKEIYKQTKRGEEKRREQNRGREERMSKVLKPVFDKTLLRHF